MGNDNEGKMKANGMPALDANQTGGSGLPVRTKVILLYRCARSNCSASRIAFTYCGADCDNRLHW